MAIFSNEIIPLLKAEGGLNTNPADRGGLTKYGISKKNNPDINVESLTPEDAASIYKTRYWDAIGGDGLPQETAAVAFDAAVNHGVGRAKNLLKATGGDPVKMLQGRKRIYDSIVRNDPSQEQFYNGWMNRLKNLSQRLGNAVIGTAEASDMPDQETLAKYQQWKAAKQNQPDTELMAKYDQWKAAKAQQPAQPEVSTVGAWIDEAGQNLKNQVGGFVGHAGGIGNTLLSAGDAYNELVGNKHALSSLDSTHAERGASMEEGLRSMGVDTESGGYKTIGLATDVFSTLGVPGLVAKGAAAIPGLSRLAASIGSSGIAGKGLMDRIAGGAVAGGAQAGLVNPEDAGIGAVIGGALPPLAYGARKVGAKLGGSGVSDEVAKLANRANELGIDIPVDRITKSKPVNALAASLEYVPLSGRTQTMEKMGSQINKAVSRTFGQDSDNITQALRNADMALGQKFDDTLKNNAVKIDDEMLSAFARNMDEANSQLPFKEQREVLQKQIDNFINESNNGILDGNKAYGIKKRLDRMSKSNDTDLAYFARQIKDTLMDGLNRSLGAEKADEFALLRKQYGNMKQIEKIAQNGAEGDISIARLANMKNINNADLQELADIAAQFAKGRESAHGAAQRVSLGGLGAGLTGYLGGVPAAVGGMALGRGANAFLNSNFARNSALKGAPSIEQQSIVPYLAKLLPVLSAQ